jgi:hypothetical protein
VKLLTKYERRILIMDNTKESILGRNESDVEVLDFDFEVIEMDDVSVLPETAASSGSSGDNTYSTCGSCSCCSSSSCCT